MASSEYGIEGRGRDTDLHPAGSAQNATASPCRFITRGKKKGQQLTTLQEQAQAVESRIRELASSNATVSAAARGPLSAIAAALPVALAVTREPSFSSNITSSGSSTAAAIVAVALAT